VPDNPDRRNATWSRRGFLTTGLVGVAALYSGARMLPAAMAASSTRLPRARPEAIGSANLVLNPSFEDGPGGRSAPQFWTMT
jgi:hypothetical protein